MWLKYETLVKTTVQEDIDFRYFFSYQATVFGAKNKLWFSNNLCF